MAPNPLKVSACNPVLLEGVDSVTVLPVTLSTIVPATMPVPVTVWPTATPVIEVSPVIWLLPYTTDPVGVTPASVIVTSGAPM